MSNVIYLDTARLRAAAEAVAAIEPCAFHGRVTSDQVMIALGEFGDIWPAVIEPVPSILSVAGQGPVPCKAIADRSAEFGDMWP